VTEALSLHFWHFWHLVRQRTWKHTCPPQFYTLREAKHFVAPHVHAEDGRCVSKSSTPSLGFIYNFCMITVLVKEADLNRIEVPGDYEVLDVTEDHDAVHSRLL
jgi:hypothetical protein